MEYDGVELEVWIWCMKMLECGKDFMKLRDLACEVELDECLWLILVLFLILEYFLYVILCIYIFYCDSKDNLSTIIKFNLLDPLSKSFKSFITKLEFFIVAYKNYICYFTLIS